MSYRERAAPMPADVSHASTDLHILQNCGPGRSISKNVESPQKPSLKRYIRRLSLRTLLYPNPLPTIPFKRSPTFIVRLIQLCLLYHPLLLSLLLVYLVSWAPMLPASYSREATLSLEPVRHFL